jgi:hypothetical protein
VTRRVLLLTAWLAFDLATPLPGAFEFEIQNSEIEHSVHAGREVQVERAAPSRATPRERIASDRPSRTPVMFVAAARDGWVSQVRLAHRPSAARASSPEDH